VVLIDCQCIIIVFRCLLVRLAKAANLSILEAVNPPASISTPCTKVCIVDGKTGLCVGCGRTLAEIAAWGGMDEGRRRAIMADLRGRLRKPSERHDQ